MLYGKAGDKVHYIGIDIDDKNITLSSDEQDISYWDEQGINSPYAPRSSSRLDTAIANVLKEKYRSDKPDGLVHIQSYYLLAHESTSGTPLVSKTNHMEETTVYMIVFHMRYKIGGMVEEVDGDFVPTAITFSVDKNGYFSLKEYWTPRTSTSYESDIRNKFPGASSDDALNIEKYAEILTNDSWSQASAYLQKHSQTIYEQTPAEEIGQKYDNAEFVIIKAHYQTKDGIWMADGYSYKYRLEITGRLNNASKDTTYIVLSNTSNITFEQTWKASGLSSLSTDYFKPEYAVIVGNRLF